MFRRHIRNGAGDIADHRNAAHPGLLIALGEAKISKLCGRSREIPFDQNVLFFNIPVDKSLPVSEIEGIQCLLYYLHDFAVIELPASMFCKLCRIHPDNKFGHKINKTVMRAVFYIAHYVRMTQRGRNFDLAHKPLE